MSAAKMTNAQFARYASSIAREATAWAADVLYRPDSEISSEAVGRFIATIRDRVEWLEADQAARSAPASPPPSPLKDETAVKTSISKTNRERAE